MATNVHSSTPTLGVSSELDLAAALYQALACGHERLAYNVTGTYALWARGAGGRGWQPAIGAELVPRGEWRPCLEVLPDGSTRPRRLTPWTIASHVRGRYSVAPAAPSWCGWLAFDIDAHVAREVLADPSDDVIPLAAIQRAIAARDQVLAELWRALELGPERLPIVLRSPGQGLHVYLPLTRGPTSPLEHTWPAGELVERTCEVLQRRGVALAAGRLEIYPAGRPLRAPCAVGSLLLLPTRPDRADELGLEPVAGTTSLRRAAGDAGVERVRRPWAMVAALLAQWQAARRPLAEWLREPSAVWSPAWGPFAWREAPPNDGVLEKNGAVGEGGDYRSQHIDEVPGGPRGRPVGWGGSRSGSDPGTDLNSTPLRPFARTPASTSPPTGLRSVSPLLRRGRAFREHLAALLRHGVAMPGTRHDAVLSLVFAWHVEGKSEGQVRAALEAWARAHPHVSRLKGERLVRTCLREGMHYYHRIKKLPQRARALASTLARTRALEPVDRVVLAQVRADVREEAWAILEYLHGHAEPGGRVGRPVTLGRAQLDALVVSDRRVPIDGRGRHRAEVVAVRELERLGVLALHCDYSTGHHGRVFNCWYQFGSGTVAGPAGSSSARVVGARVVGTRPIREGTLRVLCDGTRRAPRVELEPHGGIVLEPGGGSGWWRAMYEARRFTPAEFFEADEAVLIAGPWPRPPRPVVAVPAAPPVAPASPPPPPPPTVDPRTALAAALGADLDQVADFDAELAALAARAFDTLDRRRPT